MNKRSLGMPMYQGTDDLIPKLCPRCKAENKYQADYCACGRKLRRSVKAKEDADTIDHFSRGYGVRVREFMEFSSNEQTIDRAGEGRGGMIQLQLNLMQPWQIKALELLKRVDFTSVASMENWHNRMMKMRNNHPAERER